MCQRVLFHLRFQERIKIFDRLFKASVKNLNPFFPQRLSVLSMMDTVSTLINNRGYLLSKRLRERL